MEDLIGQFMFYFDILKKISKKNYFLNQKSEDFAFCVFIFTSNIISFGKNPFFFK